MWSTSKRDRWVRLILLFINCATCIAIVYAYTTYTNKEEKRNEISSKNFIRPEKLTDEQCAKVCDSRACIWHANMFLKNINENIDPCDDFGSFLCSGFIAEFGADENANMLSQTRKSMTTRLKGILDNIEAEPDSASAKMKTLYDSCVDYGSSELQGIKKFKNMLNDIGILNWPDLPEDFSFNGVKLSEILGNLLVLGPNHYIFLRRMSGNETQENYVLVTFYEYTYKLTTNLTRDLAVSMLSYFDLEEKQMDIIIQDYELVQQSILKLYQDYGTCHDDNCPEVHVDCFRQIDDEWLEFCETLGFFLHFNDSTKWYPIAIETPEDIFFKELFSLLHSFPNRTLANFVALSLTKSFQAELNFYFRLSKLKQKDFEHESFIGTYELERWKYCVRWIIENIKLPLQNEFFHQYLTNSATEEIINIYKDLSSELSDLIVLQKWIPTMLKSSLAEQLRNTTFNLDNIRRILPNDSYVNKVYEKFVPTRKSFFDNIIKLRRCNPIIRALPREIPNEEIVLLMTSFDVQAAAAGPSLDMHLGMLLPPFYIPGHMNLVNRVLLAPIIGHEFGHNIYGMLVYQASDLEIFLEKRQCLRDQFSKFKFQYLNENLNGSSYDMENVPDNVATSIIDKVIEQYSSSQDIILPGLTYSTKQLLYMSSIQMWCAKSNLERDLLHRDKDHHAPTEYRLLGMMQNSRGPSEAFHCPEGSFMNPATKCALLDANDI